VDVWEISLSSWIIQDGNYPDFRRGQEAEFALHAAAGELEVTAGPEKSIKQLEECRYEIAGQVIFVKQGLWVIDFGLEAFDEFHKPDPPPEVQEGHFVTGGFFIEVDPFFYFERGAKIPGVPPLVYTWRVDQILMQTAPFIETAPRMPERDPAAWGWTEIEQTNAWEDDDSHAEYLLRCQRLHVPPKHRSATAS
jgi:hypothetical protein